MLEVAPPSAPREKAGLGWSDAVVVAPRENVGLGCSDAPVLAPREKAGLGCSDAGLLAATSPKSVGLFPVEAAEVADDAGAPKLSFGGPLLVLSAGLGAPKELLKAAGAEAGASGAFWAPNSPELDAGFAAPPNKPPAAGAVEFSAGLGGAKAGVAEDVGLSVCFAAAPNMPPVEAGAAEPNMPDPDCAGGRPAGVVEKDRGEGLLVAGVVEPPPPPPPPKRLIPPGGPTPGVVGLSVLLAGEEDLEPKNPPLRGGAAADAPPPPPNRPPEGEGAGLFAAAALPKLNPVEGAAAPPNSDFVDPESLVAEGAG